jgi:hypothetical protein
MLDFMKDGKISCLVLEFMAGGDLSERVVSKEMVGKYEIQ